MVDEVIDHFGQTVINTQAPADVLPISTSIAK